jgi:hypothetical protein
MKTDCPEWRTLRTLSHSAGTVRPTAAVGRATLNEPAPGLKDARPSARRCLLLRFYK